MGEDKLQTYIDGRLDDERRALVEAYLPEHLELRDRVMLNRRHREALRAQPACNATAVYRTFVVEVAHPVEVPALNKTHLVKWLSKRLERPLVAPNPSRFGYKLMGGRLLLSGSGAAAQRMYDDTSGSD
jgi:anti-sigma factor RsiW